MARTQKRRKAGDASKPKDSDGKPQSTSDKPRHRSNLTADGEDVKRVVTPFRAKVYDVVRRIPAGKVTTYGSIAKYLGCNSAQAIGQAMRHNPYAMAQYQPPYPPEMVPCHRVVSTNNTIGGFSGATDISSSQICRKEEMLTKEGVKLKRGSNAIKLAEPEKALMDLSTLDDRHTKSTQ